MGKRIRAFDWAATSLGAPNAWPPSLKAMVRLALTTQHPIFIFWGPEHICLYNDAYSGSLGSEKHPGILGAKGREAWPEIWQIIGTQIDFVMRGEGATWHENQLVPILRHGHIEDVYWTYSFGPINDDSAENGVGGVVVICTETTQQVITARRLASERERLARLFEQAPGFMCMLHGAEHRFEFANPAYMRLIGHRDILGRAMTDALPEVVGQGFLELLDDVYRSGKAVTRYGTSFSLPEADGTPHQGFIDFVYQPITDEAGGVVGIFVEGVDVTARVRNEQALRKSETQLREREEQLRLATEAAEVGFWDVDMVADSLFWPPRVKAMFGISADAVVSLADFYAGLHPGDVAHTMSAFNAALDPLKRELYDVDFRTVGKEDGRVRWVAAKGRGIFDDAGRCVRALGTAIDITARKAAEARLQELNDILEKRFAEALADKKILADIVESTDAFVQVTDLNFRVLAINGASAREFERLYGKRLTVGENMLDVLNGLPEHRAEVAALWGRALAGDEFTTVREFGDPKRARRFYEIKFNTLRNTTGARIGAYQFVYDVTDRIRNQHRLARAEESLCQAQKMQAMGQLTGGIAHDFNNVLQSVQGALQLIERVPTDERVQGWAQGGLRSITRGAALTSQLLTFAREQKVELRPVCVSELVKGMQEMLQRSIGPLIRLHIDAGDPQAVSIIDPTQLEMAILNLAINARDAMAEGGSLTIETCVREIRDHASLAPGEYVEIVVRDTGEGMDEHVVARVFEPFFTTKAVGKGSGLGLSQVYGLVRKAGGFAQIDSEPRRGTTITLLLPSAASMPAPAHQAENIPAAGRIERSRILVVDDDPEVRATLVDLLAVLGYRVSAAENGVSCLRALNESEHDLLILDFAMPGMNGAEVATQVRRLYPGLPIIFSSGYADTAAIEAAIGPAALILRKPFEIAELQAAVTKFV